MLTLDEERGEELSTSRPRRQRKSHPRKRRAGRAHCSLARADGRPRPSRSNARHTQHTTDNSQFLRQTIGSSVLSVTVSLLTTQSDHSVVYRITPTPRTALLLLSTILSYQHRRTLCAPEPFPCSELPGEAPNRAPGARIVPRGRRGRFIFGSPTSIHQTDNDFIQVAVAP